MKPKFPLTSNWPLLYITHRDFRRLRAQREDREPSDRDLGERDIVQRDHRTCALYGHQTGEIAEDVVREVN